MCVQALRVLRRSFGQRVTLRQVTRNSRSTLISLTVSDSSLARNTTTYWLREQLSLMVRWSVNQPVMRNNQWLDHNASPFKLCKTLLCRNDRGHAHGLVSKKMLRLTLSINYTSSVFNNNYYYVPVNNQMFINFRLHVTREMHLQFEAAEVQCSVLPPGDALHSHELSHKRSRRRRRHVTASQRQAANRRERHRMSQLNDAFNELRDRVPVPDYERKPSRIDTLKLATDYIQFMTRLLATRDTSSISLAKPCCSRS